MTYQDFPGKHLIPDHMRSELADYLHNGMPPGRFLEAVLANDLVAAFGEADQYNEDCMWNWAAWLYNYAPLEPVACWGSRERLDYWCRMGGARGLGLNIRGGE